MAVPLEHIGNGFVESRAKKPKEVLDIRGCAM